MAAKRRVSGARVQDPLPAAVMQMAGMAVPAVGALAVEEARPACCRIHCNAVAVAVRRHATGDVAVW